MNIFDLKLEQQKLMDELNWCDTDKEMEEILKQLDNVYANAKGKINFVSTLLIEAKGQTELTIKSRKLAAERLKKQIKRKEKIEQRLEDYIVNAMLAWDIEKLECDLCNITRSLSPGRVVLLDNFDSSKIPADCVEVIPAEVKPLLNQIAKHLRAGEEIEGCELHKEQTIRVS